MRVDSPRAAPALDLTGRVVLVTGAAAGIGRAISLGMAAAGAGLALVDADTEELARTETMVNEQGQPVIALTCDVTDEDQIVRAVAVALDFFGHIDVLVNNAGRSLHSRPEALSLADWHHVMDVNVTAYFLFAREIGRSMIERGTGGAIVNISSIGGSSSLGRGSFVYGIAKAAIIQLTRELAIEWAPHGIRTNAVQPCQVRTPALERLLADPKFDSDALMERFLRGIPVGRLAETEDIVGPVVFLASDAAAMVTGTSLPVDGGNLAFNAGGTVGQP